MSYVTGSLLANLISKNLCTIIPEHPLASLTEICNHCNKRTESLTAFENHLEIQHEAIGDYWDYTSIQ